MSAVSRLLTVTDADEQPQFLQCSTHAWQFLLPSQASPQCLMHPSKVVVLEVQGHLCGVILGLLLRIRSSARRVLQGQQQPNRPFGEAKDTEGFTRKSKMSERRIPFSKTATSCSLESSI